MAHGPRWRQAYARRRFTVLLVILVAVLAGPPILFGHALSPVWFDGFVSLQMLAAILSLCFDRMQRVIALVLGIPTILLSVGGTALPGEVGDGALFGGRLCAIVFC